MTRRYKKKSHVKSPRHATRGPLPFNKGRLLYDKFVFAGAVVTVVIIPKFVAVIDAFVGDKAGYEFRRSFVECGIESAYAFNSGSCSESFENKVRVALFDFNVLCEGVAFIGSSGYIERNSPIFCRFFPIFLF